jgi:hypothetical protein
MEKNRDSRNEFSHKSKWKDEVSEKLVGE